MSSKIKKIGYLSVILMVVAGTIGAGIFFKNKSINSMAQGNLWIVIATWGVSIFGMIALAVALIEISSAQKTNKGPMEWTKLFTPRWFHKSSSNYIKYLFIPMSLFTLPLYVTNALEDAGMTLHSEWAALGIAFIWFAWVMGLNYISIRMGNIQNWVTTTLQVLPLVALPIIAMAHAGDVSTGTILDKQTGNPGGFIGLSPWLAIFGGMGAIAFAYDGFYMVSTIRNETDSPEKVGKGMVVGVVIISIFYMFVTIGFQLSGDGTVYGIYSHMPQWLFQVMNIGIAFGILGIINSYAMGSPRQYRDMADEKENSDLLAIEKFVQRIFPYFKKAKDGRVKTHFLIITMMATFFFIVLGSIGIATYTDGYSWTTSVYAGPYPTDGLYSTIYGGGSLYTFADAITSFTSLLMFVIIAVSVLGAIINRKTNRVEVKRVRFFLFFAWSFVILMGCGILFTIIAAFVDATGFNGADQEESITQLCVFLGIIVSSVTPAIISEIREKRKETQIA